jgi:hypothetical protein
MDTINLAPTAEGYANIAKTFAASILGDVKVSRRKSSAALLDSLIEVVAYLSKADPTQVDDIRGFVKRNA